MSVDVDCEKLADGIERGFYPGLEPPYESHFKRLQLRQAMCGIASASVQAHLDTIGVPSRLLITRPNLPFDRGMEHVIVSIDDDPNDSLVIDPTYSQFLKYTGYDIAYEYISKSQVYPPERIIAFRTSERLAIVKNIARIALGFRDIKEDLVLRTGFEWGEDWLPKVTTQEEMVKCLEPIWNPTNFNSFTPNTKTLHDAKDIGKYIDQGAITIENRK